MSANLLLSSFEKSFIDEMATIQSISPLKVREIMEAIFIRQLEAIAEHKEVHIPYIGKALIRTTEEGLNILIIPSELLKTIVNQLETGNNKVLYDLFEKKISSKLQVILESE